MPVLQRLNERIARRFGFVELVLERHAMFEHSPAERRGNLTRSRRGMADGSQGEPVIRRYPIAGERRMGEDREAEAELTFAHGFQRAANSRQTVRFSR